MRAKSTDHNASNPSPKTFSGNIFIFHAFDIGDEINLEKVKTSNSIMLRPYTPPKYFKNYHIPLAAELPHPHTTSNCISTKLHNFGAVSLTYKIPFDDTLEEIQESLALIHNRFQEESVSNLSRLYKKIEPFTTKPSFFHTKSSYLIIQIDPQIGLDGTTLKKEYGGTIASALRFETSVLSEYQKNQILDSAFGYFKGDLIIINTEAALVYDPDYEELLELFEFANIQQLELRYFDRVLDQQLNSIYEEQKRTVPLKSYLPFIGTFLKSPVDELGKLKVDISVITERLSSSIKVTGEPYFSELYASLEKQLDIKNWKETIEKKLTIVQDVQSLWQHKIDAVREDILTSLIIVLIIIELIVAIIR